MATIITFIPFYHVELDPSTGEMTGRFDWSDSSLGEGDDNARTALAEAVGAVIDRHELTAATYSHGLLPVSYVAVTEDGIPWGAIVCDTREECERKIEKVHRDDRARGYRNPVVLRVEEVRVPA